MSLAASTSAGSGGIATFLLLAFYAALYPTLLAAVVILLAQERPLRLLATYLAGGMLMSVGVGLAIVFALGGSPRFSQSSGLSWTADLAIGGLALLAAVALSLRADERVRRRRAERRSRRRPEPAPPQPPPSEDDREPWSQRILARGSLPIVFVAALAINLPGAAYLIALKDLATAHHSTVATVALILLFNVIMFALAEVPLLGLLFARERTEGYVERMDDWMSGHSREIAIGLSAAFGAFLIVRGILNAT